MMRRPEAAVITPKLPAPIVFAGFPHCGVLKVLKTSQRNWSRYRSAKRKSFASIESNVTVLGESTPGITRPRLPSVNRAGREGAFGHPLDSAHSRGRLPLIP